MNWSILRVYFMIYKHLHSFNEGETKVKKKYLRKVNKCHTQEKGKGKVSEVAGPLARLVFFGLFWPLPFSDTLCLPFFRPNLFPALLFTFGVTGPLFFTLSVHLVFTFLCGPIFFTLVSNLLHHF